MQSVKCLTKTQRKCTALKTFIFSSSSPCFVGRGESGACCQQGLHGLTSPAPGWFLQHLGSPVPILRVGLGVGSHTWFSSSWQVRCRAADPASPSTGAASHLQRRPTSSPAAHLLPVSDDPTRQLHIPPGQHTSSSPPVATAAGSAAPPLPSGIGARSRFLRRYRDGLGIGWGFLKKWGLSG